MLNDTELRCLRWARDFAPAKDPNPHGPYAAVDAKLKAKGLVAVDDGRITAKGLNCLDMKAVRLACRLVGGMYSNPVRWPYNGWPLPLRRYRENGEHHHGYAFDDRFEQGAKPCDINPVCRLFVKNNEGRLELHAVFDANRDVHFLTTIPVDAPDLEHRIRLAYVKLRDFMVEAVKLRREYLQICERSRRLEDTYFEGNRA